jgi:Pectate lyase superfamily protein
MKQLLRMARLTLSSAEHRLIKNVGAPFVPTRDHYENVVNEWKNSNPHLVNQIEDEHIETLWNHLTRDPTSSTTKRSSSEKAPVQKRQDIPQSDLDVARKLVSAVVAEVERHNEYLMGNHEQASWAINGTSNYHAPFPVANETVARAAAMVAEADAAELASQGKLFKDYTFTGNHSKFNVPGIPTGSSLEKRDSYYWLADMATQFPGNFPFGGDASYKVFRNVKDPQFGAVGDGVHDDTAAINAAIAFGNRCADNCGSSSVKGALIYFPPGKVSLWVSYSCQQTTDFNFRNLPS